ncbi:lambda-exonuclease family protein [Zavarzinella formosa]|uniref:lambda-exonuclease family protein n=1 Tax=Zavarzinella formosa TaxID=360055 RepID=UPI0002FDFD7B|nr:YqaJ viral recombinase family protein [Zavarzinella formosa]
MRVIQLNQGSREWTRWRRNGIGGGDIAALLGLSPFPEATADGLLAEKLGDTERATNFAMRRGVLLEPQARAMFEAREKTGYVPMCVEHDTAPWMRASLDGYSHARNDIIEVKAPSFKVHDLALAGLVPDHYLCQVQWQLLVTDCRVCHFVSYNPAGRFQNGAELAVVRVTEDAEHQAAILEAAEMFWMRVADSLRSRMIPAGACP